MDSHDDFYVMEAKNVSRDGRDVVGFPKITINTQFFLKIFQLGPRYLIFT